MKGAVTPVKNRRNEQKMTRKLKSRAARDCSWSLQHDFCVDAVAFGYSGDLLVHWFLTVGSWLMVPNSA